MTDNFLQKLMSAKNDDERSWLVTQNLLNSLPENVQRAVFAAAIPHWFNKEILVALLPDIFEEISSIYSKIQSFPFTEPYQGRGSNIHETTRKFILDYLWKNNLDLYKSFSQSASKYFLAEFERNKDKQIRIEQIYHTVIAESKENSQVIWEQGAEWHDERDYTYSTLNALILSIQEHIEANRVEGIAVGWTWFWDALIASYHYEYDKAKTLFKRAISTDYGNDTLKANCIQALGDVHNKLSELPEARARYEEALPLYRAIGEKIGEMYTILNLADVASKEKKFDLAIQLAESTIETAKKISPSNVASAFNNLANIYEKKKDYPKAIEFYTKAMEIFTGSQAYMIRNRANVYLKMADAENAEKDIVRAEQIQPNNPFLFLRKGELANLKGNFEEAIIFFMKAIDIIPRFSGAFFGIGMSNLRAGKIQEAKISYQQGLSFTDAVDELEDTIEELEKLKSRQPSLLGVDDILEMLKTWKPDKK